MDDNASVDDAEIRQNQEEKKKEKKIKQVGHEMDVEKLNTLFKKALKKAPIKNGTGQGRSSSGHFMPKNYSDLTWTGLLRKHQNSPLCILCQFCKKKYKIAPYKTVMKHVNKHRYKNQAASYIFSLESQ